MHARPRAHAARPGRQAARRDGRGRHRHARAVQPGERLVRDRRARARRPTTCAPSWWRAVAVVDRDDPWPHLFTEFPEGAPSELPNDHLHPAIEVEAADGAAELVGELPERPARARRRAVPAVAGARRPRASSTRDVVLAPGQAHEDARRARVHPPGAGDQRAGDAHRARAGRGPACSPPTSRARSCARSPSSARRRTPSTRCSRSCRASIADGPVQRHRRSGVPAPDAAARARRPATCCGSTPASTSTATRPTSARRGSSAASPTTHARSSSTSGARSSTACSRSRSPARPAPTSCAPRPNATAGGRGCRTSTSRTASAPTARRCR